MDYLILDKNNGLIKEYKDVACFSQIASFKNKAEVGYVQYKPKLHKEIIDADFYLSELKTLPFFICENKNISSIISDGIVVSAKMPILNMYVILLLVRYLEEKPERVASFINLVTSGISVSTALAFCHVIPPSSRTYNILIDFGHHSMFSSIHIINPNCIINYARWLQENISAGTPYYKDNSYTFFRLWEFISTRESLEYNTSINNFIVKDVNELIKDRNFALNIARQIDK